MNDTYNSKMFKQEVQTYGCLQLNYGKLKAPYISKQCQVAYLRIH